MEFHLAVCRRRRLLAFGGLFSWKCREKILFLSGLVFRDHFRKFSGANFCSKVLIFALRILVPSSLSFCSDFSALLPEMLGKNSLLVRSGFLRPFSENFRERTSVSWFRFLLCVFLVPSSHSFCTVLGVFLPEMLVKNSLLVRSGFATAFGHRPLSIFSVLSYVPSSGSSSVFLLCMSCRLSSVVTFFSPSVRQSSVFLLGSGLLLEPLQKALSVAHSLTHVPERGGTVLATFSWSPPNNSFERYVRSNDLSYLFSCLPHCDARLSGWWQAVGVPVVGGGHLYPSVLRFFGVPPPPCCDKPTETLLSATLPTQKPLNSMFIFPAVSGKNKFLEVGLGSSRVWRPRILASWAPEQHLVSFPTSLWKLL